MPNQFQIDGNLHSIEQQGQFQHGGAWVQFYLYRRTEWKGRVYENYIKMKAIGTMANNILSTPLGQPVDLVGKIKSREWNGKWLLDLEVTDFAQHVQPGQLQQAAQPPAPPPAPAPSPAQAVSEATAGLATTQAPPAPGPSELERYNAAPIPDQNDPTRAQPTLDDIPF